MRVLVDMNLSPSWCNLFRTAGIDAVHWSTVGDPRAADVTILAWARDNDYVVFTHDLDFGGLLATGEASAPSVVQVRTADVTPATLGDTIVGSLRMFADEIASGVLLTIDETRTRARILPLRR